MKKGEKNIKLSVIKFSAFIFLAVLVGIAVGVYAYGTGSPTTSGHTWNEIANIPAGFADGVDNDAVNPYYPAGLYGHCFSSYSHTYSGSYCLSNWAVEPAYCTSSGGCWCRDGYTREALGSTDYGYGDARSHEWYWACRKI